MRAGAARGRALRENQKTTFTVTFPLQKEVPARFAPAEPSPNRHHRPAGEGRVTVARPHAQDRAPAKPLYKGFSANG